MRDGYYICGLFVEMHRIDGKDYAWGTQRFLNVESKTRLYYYTEVPEKESLVFETKEDADSYIKQHKLNENRECCNVKEHFSVEVYEC